MPAFVYVCRSVDIYVFVSLIICICMILCMCGWCEAMRTDCVYLCPYGSLAVCVFICAFLCTCILEFGTIAVVCFLPVQSGEDIFCVFACLFVRCSCLCLYVFVSVSILAPMPISKCPESCFCCFCVIVCVCGVWVSVLVFVSMFLLRARAHLKTRDKVAAHDTYSFHARSQKRDSQNMTITY